MRLVVAEKPSVARDLARVLGVRGKGEACFEDTRVRITWCIGHLAELEDPAHYDAAWKKWSFETLPMIPERFALRLRGEGDVKAHFAALKRHLRDKTVTEVVNACDAGREGELIFRYVYELAGCARPVLRLWTSSLTDEAIRAAWARLRSGADLDALADAARCRSEADWLVGMNATRALTCLARQGGGEQLLSVGRVQTPTLAMIVARDRQIAAFVPEPYWMVKARFAAEGKGSWEATFFQRVRERERSDRDDATDREAPPAERIGDRATAEAIASATAHREGAVVQAERKRVREPPPLLYDLTALQRRANERYGLSAPDTLAIAQALYEKHKLLTYPRTDARHLTPDQVPGLGAVVEGVGKLPVYAPFADAILAKPIRPGPRVVDAAEVGDHHAILPTGRTPDPARLTADERRVFDLVARRLLAALSPDAIFDATTLVVEVPPPAGAAALPPLLFRARGRVCREEGWRAVDPPGKSREIDLPAVDRGDRARAEAVRVVEEKTRPPRPYNDATLLAAMETAGRTLDDEALARALRNAGLGTPATRAAILETLLQRRYVTRSGRDLRATDRGRALIDAVPLEELKSAELTGRWEARLAAVAERRDARDAFMRDVGAHVRGVVAAIAAAAPPPAEVSDKRPGPSLGACPLCGAPVRETARVFACDTGRACAFVVYKTMSGRSVGVRAVKQLLARGRTDVLKGFESKAGKPFDAALTWRDGKVQFDFSARAGDDHGGSDATASAPPGAESSRPRRRTPRGGSPSAPASADRPAAAPASADRPAAAPVSTPAPAPPAPVGMACPACGEGRIVRGRAAWGCDRWRAGCRFVLPFDADGRALSEAEAAARIARR